MSCVSLIQKNEEEQSQSIVISKCIKIDKRWRTTSWHSLVPAWECKQSILLVPSFQCVKSSTCHYAWHGGDLAWEFPSNKVTWSYMITWQTKIIISPLLQCHKTWQDVYLPWGAFSDKVAWTLGQVVLWDYVAS